jgi:hypothetical protein
VPSTSLGTDMKCCLIRGVLEGPNGVGWLHCLKVRDKMPHRWALPLCKTFECKLKFQWVSNSFLIFFYTTVSEVFKELHEKIQAIYLVQGPERGLTCISVGLPLTCSSCLVYCIVI